MMQGKIQINHLESFISLDLLPNTQSLIFISTVHVSQKQQIYNPSNLTNEKKNEV